MEDLVDRRTLAEQLMDKLRQYVETEGLKAGAKLPDVESLCQKYGVSRSVVREALARLSATGYVRVEHGKGVFLSEGKDVLPINLYPFQIRSDEQSLLKLLEIRRILEVEAAALAATRGSEDDYKLLFSVHDRLLQCRGVDEIIGCDLQFHLCLARCSGNEILVTFLQSIVELLLICIRQSYYAAEARERVISEHSSIIECVRRKDAQGASCAMANHMRVIEKRIRERRDTTADGD